MWSLGRRTNCIAGIDPAAWSARKSFSQVSIRPGPQSGLRGANVPLLSGQDRSNPGKARLVAASITGSTPLTSGGLEVKSV